MSKKLAILLVILGEALTYLFIFVAIPALEGLTCPDCRAASDFEPPLFLYIIPGLVGAFSIVVILLRKKKEVNRE